MIRIQAGRFKKKALGGSLLLDRAAVVVIGIDLRENRGGSPGIRCDIAYGVEAQGKFQPFNYDDPAATVPFYVEPHQFASYRGSAVAVMAKLRGSSLLDALVIWFEAELVAQGKFGPDATVV